MDAEEHDVAGRELLRNCQKADAAAPVEAVEPDLVGAAQLIRPHQVSVVGVPGIWRRAYRRSWLFTPGRVLRRAYTSTSGPN